MTSASIASSCFRVSVTRKASPESSRSIETPPFAISADDFEVVPIVESYVGSAKFAGAGAVSSFAFGRVSVGAATRTNFESASDEEDGSPTANFPAGPRVGLGAPGRRERTPPWG